MIPTLAELNATVDSFRTWSAYTLRPEFAVGYNGRHLRGTSGSKVHLLFVERVVAEDGDHRPGTYKVGDAFSTHAPCNGNGQQRGLIRKHLDTDAVTCKFCRARLELLATVVERARVARSA